MANLLLDPFIKLKVEEICGEMPSDLWLDIAWESLNKLVGYELDFDSKTDIRSGNGKDIIYLTKRPVKEITEIKINNRDRVISEFEIYEGIGIRNKLGCFDVGIGKCFPISKMGSYTETDCVEITYNAGYDETDFPNDLIFAACFIIQAKKQSSSDAGTLKSYKISDISYTWKSQEELNVSIENYVRDYRAM
ncbi:unnamed protein product [marine sediment metagenome]|uniref:Uncharacterized protein n=1 Tax=marine sediment metagenome TaxID=412755 RepID=X1B1P3_9ZZZZ